MTTALEGGEGPASRPGPSLPPGKTLYLLHRRLVGLQGRSGQVWKTSPPPGFDPRTVQPVASRYTNYATRPTQTYNQDVNWLVLYGVPRWFYSDISVFNFSTCPRLSFAFTIRDTCHLLYCIVWHSQRTVLPVPSKRYLSSGLFRSLRRFLHLLILWKINTRFEVLTAVRLKILVFWDVTQLRRLSGSRRFERLWPFIFKYSTVQQEQCSNISNRFLRTAVRVLVFLMLDGTQSSLCLFALGLKFSPSKRMRCAKFQ